MAASKRGGETARMNKRPRRQLFYAIFLPVAVTVNLVLGVIILDELRPTGWLGGLEMTTGAFCCAVAGWLAAAAWSRSYWARAISHQVAAWRQVADAIFGWMEESPPPADALLRLQGSLDDLLPQNRAT